MTRRTTASALQTPARTRAPAHGLLLCMFFLTGGCGLIYEITWSRLLVLVMGASTFATTTVLVAFMGGLALGSYVSGRLVHRLANLPVAYGVLEIVVGLYALALPFLLDAAVPLYRFLYHQTEASFVLLTMSRFVVSAAVLMVPTTVMGATLPLLVQYWCGTGRRPGASVAMLYGVNSFGAVLGAALAGFVLIPAIGLQMSILGAAVLNYLIGTAAIVLLRGRATRRSGDDSARRKREAKDLADLRAARPRLERVAVIAFGLSGAAAMAYQVAWTRALVVSIGPHTYSFTCIVTAYILGLAAGSLLMRRRADRTANPLAWFGLLEIGIALSAFVVCALMEFIPPLCQRINATFWESFRALMVMNFLLVLLVVLLPTLQMGAIFPLIGRICTRRDDRSGESIGRAYAVNTVGTILGAFLAGFVLIPNQAVGSQGTLLGACALNALVGVVLMIYSATGGLRYVSPWPVVVGLSIAVLPVPMMSRFRWDPSRSVNSIFLLRTTRRAFPDVLFYREGIDGTVAVTKDLGSLSLRINGKADASDSLADGTTQLSLGHIPSMLAGRADRVMVLGLGSGMTVAALACNDDLNDIDCLEISQGVVAAARYFTETNYNILDHPRLHLIRADGRNHLLLTDRTYDIIVNEPSNPWLAGMANLFTQEYYELCRSRLSDDGLLCTWMHAYLISPEDFKLVLRTVCEVFPYVSVWSTGKPDYLFIAAKAPLKVPLDGLLAVLSKPAVKADLARIFCDRPEAMLGMYMAGNEAVREWVADTPVHRDDRPTLEYAAPQAMLTASDRAPEIFLHLADRLSSPFDDLLVWDRDNPVHAELKAKVDNLQEYVRLRAAAIRAARAGDAAGYLRSAAAAVKVLPDEPAAHRLVKAACDFAQGLIDRQGRVELIPLKEATCANLPEPVVRPRVVARSAPNLPGGPPPAFNPLDEFK